MANEACKTKGGGGNKAENNVYFLRNHSTSRFFYALHSYMYQCYIFLHFFLEKKMQAKIVSVRIFIQF